MLLETLGRKCEFKGIPVPTVEALDDRRERAEIEAEWSNMLGHQLRELPPFEQFWGELPAVFAWPHRGAERVVHAPMPAERAVDVTWQPPPTAEAWHIGFPMEIVRFAAANRLCVDLGYQGRHRLIEPYSLRRTMEGDLLLYAVRHETGESRTYRVDRIESAKATRVPFTPRYAVELTPSGPLRVLPAAQRQRVAFRPVTAVSPRRRPSPPSLQASGGPTYVVECPLCGKKFDRKRPATRLNPHKDKDGYPCTGRSGYLVDTKY